MNQNKTDVGRSLPIARGPDEGDNISKYRVYITRGARELITSGTTF